MIQLFVHLFMILEDFRFFKNMLDVIKECYRFLFEIQEYKEQSCVHIKHIHNCMRMLLTLYFFYKNKFF